MLELLITVAVVGFIAWLITTYIPMDAPVRNVIMVIAVLIILVLALRALGIAF